MGDRGAEHTEAATPDEIAEMARLCEAGLRAGALGFTTSRTYVHPTRTRPSIGQITSGVDQSSDHELSARELELLRRLALELGRPLSFTVQQNDDTPDRFREL